MKNQLTSCGTQACESLATRPSLTEQHGVTETEFYIEKMDCPSEESQIRRRLGDVPEVESVSVDLAAHLLTVRHRPLDTSRLRDALAEIGLPPKEGRAAVQATCLYVPRMDCKNEKAQIQERLAGDPAVERLEFDLPARTLTVFHRLRDVSPILGALEELGMPAEVAPNTAAADLVLTVPKMDCVNEERQVREALGGVPGVESLSFNLPARTLLVRHTLADASPLFTALERIGMPAKAAQIRQDTFRIPKMDCKNEKALIEQSLGTMTGVERLDFDLPSRQVVVHHRLSSDSTLRQALTQLGMPAEEPAQGTPVELRLHVPNMDCKNEERQVREALENAPGVLGLEFELPSRSLTVRHELPDAAPIFSALTAIGMPARQAQAQPHTGSNAAQRALADAVRADTFLIDKMDCPTEEGMIRKRLGRMQGVEGLDFNLMQRKLTVRHSLASTQPLVDALAEIGLPPSNKTGLPGGVTTSLFRIENMDCPTEEALIRRKLEHVEGVRSLEFNLMQRKLAVAHVLNPAEIEAALHSIGMRAVAETPAQAVAAQEEEPKPSVSRKQWAMMALAGASAAVAEVIAFSTGNDRAWPVIALALVSIATGGWPTYKKGWLALKSGILNMNALMSIAVTGAILIGQWPEAAMVMFLFALAEVIEVLSLDRARNAIRGLLAMAPETATVKGPDGTWVEVGAKTVVIGQEVRIRPGERIPLDGIIETGQSAVNQAPITGESIPVAKVVGDQVFAGTINETGSFEYRVTSEASNSTLARIIKAVEEAQGSRAPTQRFVDQFAKVYTPAVFVVAIAVAVLPPLLMGAAWMDWVYKALVLLVIACPCALVISTPVTVVSGLAAAARRGILIKGGAYLEQGRQLKSLALDKTGTITQGKPEVTDVVRIQEGATDALHLAASLAGRSDHPVSGAVAAYWTSNEGAAALEVHDFEALTGRGVKGRIAGRWFYLGNHRLMQELGIANNAAQAALGSLESAGKTAVALMSESVVMAVIAVADTVRETSRQAIGELHELGVRTVMLTGDNQKTATAIAKGVGIDDARGELLPEDKLKAIEAELASSGTVGMVGDGINDAPALAKSSIGFAMGAAGTDTAIETADVALMDDDLRKIPEFIRLSRKTGAILKQNIIVALGIKAVFFALAMLGMASLWMAVFADMGASLLVVFNGLRLLKARTS